MLEGLRSIPWADLPRPPSDDRDAVPAALQALCNADSDVEASKAYHQVLDAFGNNHAGTYFPVVVWAVPFLGEILRDGKMFMRIVVLDVLIDLLGSFDPDYEWRSFRDEHGNDRDLRDALVAEVATLRGDIIACAEGGPARAAELVEQLLWLIENPRSDSCIPWLPRVRDSSGAQLVLE